MIITIQPDMTDLVPITIDVRPLGSNNPLKMAVEAFAATVGLGAFDLVYSTDRTGQDFLKFTLGSGRPAKPGLTASAGTCDTQQSPVETGLDCVP